VTELVWFYTLRNLQVKYLFLFNGKVQFENNPSRANFRSADISRGFINQQMVFPTVPSHGLKTNVHLVQISYKISLSRVNCKYLLLSLFTLVPAVSSLVFKALYLSFLAKSLNYLI